MLGTSYRGHSTVMKVGVCLMLVLFVITWANGEVNWPYGTYGLPKPKSGCPRTTWQEGWRAQDVFTGFSRLSFDSQFDVQTPSFNRTFCVKTNPGLTTTGTLWPKGFYCIYKANGSSCPKRMTEGAVQWDDQTTSSFNGNKHGGILPGGVYNSVGITKINYCCQNRGKWFNPIELPIDRPFYLLPHNNSAVSFPQCQHVNWTMSWLEYMDYDTIDQKRPSIDGDKSYGDHVFNKKIHFDFPVPRSLVRVYYCYYQGCRHEINKNRGVISSPVLNNDPQFNRCSWLITVNESLVISLQLTRLIGFHSPNCRQRTAPRLYIYDGGNSEIGAPTILECARSRFIINSENKIISSGNQMLVVFISNQKHRLKSRPSFEAKFSTVTPGYTPSTHPSDHPSSVGPTNDQSSKTSKCRSGGLTIGLVIVSLLLLITLLIAIFREKVTKLLRKLREQANGRTGETIEAETDKTDTSLHTSSFENGGFTSSNKEDKNSELHSDRDNYMDLIIDNMEPESNYQSLSGLERLENVQNTGVDDECDYVDVDVKSAQQTIPEDNIYDYPDVLSQ